MKSLGVHMSKDQAKKQLEKVDKDGSGEIDHQEFLGLMAGIIVNRDFESEMKKVFRVYDNDDNGLISKKNLYECAEELDMQD